MAGKKDALVPPVYDVQITTKVSTSGTATFRYPLKQREKPEYLTSDTNWGEADIVSIGFSSYDLHEYYARDAGEQAGVYVFYDADGEMVCTADKKYVNIVSDQEVL